MIEDNFYYGNYQNVKVTRSGDNYIFLFGSYGGLCIDSKTGSIKWKLEP